MENIKNSNGKTEDIFYAALALNVAGKPLNKENIRLVLRAAGTPIDEPALDIIGAYIESLKASHGKNGAYRDSEIVKSLTALMRKKEVPGEPLDGLLEELKRTPSTTPQGVIISDNSLESETGRSSKQPETSEKYANLNVVSEDAGVSLIKLPTDKSLSLHKGRYVYGITAGGKDVRLGPIGIDGSEVYTLSYQDLSAIVHDCPAEPYQSTDDARVKSWVQTHQSVLDAAREQFDIIIPMSFDTIIKMGDDGTSADQVVRDWLKKDIERFHTIVSRIVGRDEYAVQVSYIPSGISQYMTQPSEEVLRIKREIARKSPGIAYIYKQKLEKTLKADMEKLADAWFKDFLSRINKHVDNVIIEKTRKMDDEKVMLLNLSCLVTKEKVGSLGEELEKINNLEGFSVHFSGPWPPYSFVGGHIAAIDRKGPNGSH